MTKGAVVFTSRIAVLIAVLMVLASIGAVVARPTVKAADEEPPISLEQMIPKQFGDWREEPQRYTQVVNPQTQELLDKLYSQILSRVYVNSAGYRIMLSLAYGSNQRGSLQAHKPEVCYPAQGFAIDKNVVAQFESPFGEIPVRRLYSHLGQRYEPVTYWFTVGNTAIKNLTQKRIVELRFGLTGRIPDGMLYRVSSIDRDETRAFQMQDDFSAQLLKAVAPSERRRLSGLGLT
jgi:EpsI family protein